MIINIFKELSVPEVKLLESLQWLKKTQPDCDCAVLGLCPGCAPQCNRGIAPTRTNGKSFIHQFVHGGAQEQSEPSPALLAHPALLLNMWHFQPSQPCSFSFSKPFPQLRLPQGPCLALSTGRKLRQWLPPSAAAAVSRHSFPASFTLLPYLDSLTLHPSVLGPKIPITSHRAGVSAPSAAVCCVRAHLELILLACTSRGLWHPEQASSGCGVTAVWLERGQTFSIQLRVRRHGWSSTSPALKKQALIWVTGIVTSNLSEAVREKRLKKRCRKVIVFQEDRLGTGCRELNIFFQEISSSLNLLPAKTLKKPTLSFYQINNYLFIGTDWEYVCSEARSADLEYLPEQYCRLAGQVPWGHISCGRGWGAGHTQLQGLASTHQVNTTEFVIWVPQSLSCAVNQQQNCATQKEEGLWRAQPAREHSRLHAVSFTYLSPLRNANTEFSVTIKCFPLLRSLDLSLNLRFNTKNIFLINFMSLEMQNGIEAMTEDRYEVLLSLVTVLQFSDSLLAIITGFFLAEFMLSGLGAGSADWLFRNSEQKVEILLKDRDLAKKGHSEKTVKETPFTEEL
ncbi:hypothetical protein IHE44_0012546 [Lamprotornis superbus]|uniref:Uncharacterized protein n=1 Tax=Lamprotornis superbus TaxID=245042 RepID=A0A835P3Y4_9PASS|nr:hypothetical protein IHE44_0012546 [Lamprotornis superbus]